MTAYRLRPPEETHGVAIPIQLTLGATTLSLGAAGQWDISTAKDTPLQPTSERLQALEQRNATLEAENVALRDTCTRVMAELSMEKFKGQLLVEMLAVSSLDEERMRVQAAQEKARVDSVQTDVAALMDQARVQGLDLRKLSAVEPFQGAS